MPICGSFLLTIIGRVLNNYFASYSFVLFAVYSDVACTYNQTLYMLYIDKPIWINRKIFIYLSKVHNKTYILFIITFIFEGRHTSSPTDFESRNIPGTSITIATAWLHCFCQRRFEVNASVFSFVLQTTLRCISNRIKLFECWTCILFYTKITWFSTHLKVNTSTYPSLHNILNSTIWHKNYNDFLR